MYELFHFGVQDPTADDLVVLATGLSPEQLWQLRTNFWYEISRRSVQPDISVVVFDVHALDLLFRGAYVSTLEIEETSGSLGVERKA